MNRILNYIQSVLTDPYYFFGKRITKEKGTGGALRYLAFVGLFGLVLTAVAGLYTQEYMREILSSFLGTTVSLEPIVVEGLAQALVAEYFLILIGSFIVSAVIHIWIIFFNGKAKFAKTYQLFVYSQTPRFVFGWIPFVNLFVWIYELALLIIGTQKVHGISRNQAILMYLIPAALIFLFLALRFGLGAFAFFADPSLLANV